MQRAAAVIARAITRAGDCELLFQRRAAFVHSWAGPLLLLETLNFEGPGFDMQHFVLDDGVHGELALGHTDNFRVMHGGPERGFVFDTSRFHRENAVCGAPIRHCATASYCSPACKQRCYRARRASPRLAKVGAHPPKRIRTARVAHSVYECSRCGERFVGIRRCPDCNLYLANLGLGGACVHCDKPLLLTELLGNGAANPLD